jgi:putative transposase
MSTVGHYPTDVNEAQWEVMQLVLPPPKWRPGGPGRKPMDPRRVINGIFYVNKTGCQWRMLPTEFGPWETVYGYFRRWRLTGVWERVMDTLRHWERQSQGRLSEPSACCADSQSIKTATQGEDVGFDGHKKIKGRKRHLLVDTLGLIVAVVVTAANTDDRQGYRKNTATFHAVPPARVRPPPATLHPLGPTPGVGPHAPRCPPGAGLARAGPEAPTPAAGPPCREPAGHRPAPQGPARTAAG